MNRRAFLAVAPMAALAMLLGHKAKPDPNTIVATEDKPFRVLDQYGETLIEAKPAPSEYMLLKGRVSGQTAHKGMFIA